MGMCQLLGSLFWFRVPELWVTIPDIYEDHGIMGLTSIIHHEMYVLFSPSFPLSSIITPQKCNFRRFRVLKMQNFLAFGHIFMVFRNYGSEFHSNYPELCPLLTTWLAHPRFFKGSVPPVGKHIVTLGRKHPWHLKVGTFSAGFCTKMFLRGCNNQSQLTEQNVVHISTTESGLFITQ